MTKDHLKRIIIDQREDLQNLLKDAKTVPREGIDGSRKLLSHPNILLISGPRRIGKSFFAHLLAATHTYGFVNFDDERLIGFTAAHFNMLLECFLELYGDTEYILLDEVQNITGWELFVSRIRQNHKIIITGSNANLLSSELASHLTGRFSVFNLFPMSFKEFLDYKSITIEPTSLHSTRKRAVLEQAFGEFLRFGGIFEFYKFGPQHIRTLFSSIITKDILARYSVRHPVLLEELAFTLITAFATKISSPNLAKQFNLKSYHTIQDYISYIQNTFLIFSLNKFSFKLKEQLSSQKKIYLMDNSFIESLSFSFSENKGRLLENMMAIELKRRCRDTQDEVYYWDNYINECDFIIKSGKKISAAYQVCYELNSGNERRELSGIVSALKEFNLKSGYIITFNQKDEKVIDNKNISIVPCWEWLLS